MNADTAPGSEYLTTKQVATILGVAAETLEQHRMRKKGLPYIRLEGRILYRRSEIERHLELATVRPRPDVTP